MNWQTFFIEVKRRNVYKVAVAYLVGGWALSQGIAQVLPVFDAPAWLIRFLVVLIIIGFPIALACALCAAPARADDVTFTGFAHGSETVHFSLAAPNVTASGDVNAGGFATVLNGGPSFVSMGSTKEVGT